MPKFNPKTKEVLIASFDEGALEKRLPEEVIHYICAALEDPHCYSEDVEELNDIIAPHFIDVQLVENEEESKEKIKSLTNELFDKEIVARPIKIVEALETPINLSETQSTGTADAFFDKDERDSSVDANVLEEHSEKYLKRKQARQEKKDRIAAQKKEASLAALRSLQQEQAGSAKFVRSATSSGTRDVKLENFSIQIGKEMLVANASITLSHGRRYGLVGHNGVGKTTLLRNISSRELAIPANMSLLHVFQEASGGDETATEAVLACDVERTDLLEEANTLENANVDGLTPDEVSTRARRMAAIYARLDEIDAHTAEARARAILAGLGFDEEMQDTPTKSFSGGWRMRIALARALFAEPDLLLLDEPTNHLDLYAVLWLEQYLLTWPSTLVIVSHSREFLNAIATDIIHIHARQMFQYKGTYDDFEASRAERLRQLSRATDAADKQRQHMQKFIDRFRFNAKRAKMVQSRIKFLNKMTILPEIHQDPAIQFGFADPAPLSPPLLQFQNVTFGYDPSNPLMTKVNLNIDMDSRIALVGPNGAGKSTLLKLLAGELEPTEGHVHRNAKLRFAVFSQHFVDQLDLRESAVEHMVRKYADKKLKPQEARAKLGQFGIIGDLAIRSMQTLSGGQKSRVVLASLAFGTPQMLLLDEPSNHLDLDSVEALSLALTEFSGGVLLVSHDEHLISLVCDEIWVVGDNAVKRFDGTFAEYKKQLLKGSQYFQQ